MPPRMDLDQYLNRMFTSRGIPGRMVEPLPLQTRDFPQVTPQQLYQSRVEDEGRGFWETIFDVLRSGEYAVKSFMRSVLRGEQARTDPLTAMWRGFKSGFTGDDKYQVSMEELFNIAGWKPRAGTLESAGRSILAFAGDVLTDPLTYLTIGPAARAMRIGGKTLEQTAAKYGIKNLTKTKGFFKGQALTKAAQKTFKSLKKGATNPMRAEAEALADVSRLIQPNELLTGNLLKEVKSDAVIGRWLEAAGEKVTPTAIEKFRDKGYLELLDKGGVKFFGKTLKGPAAGYLTPRASSLHGFLMGEAIDSNLPLLPKLGKKLKANEGFNKIFLKPMHRMIDRLTRFRGMPESWKDMLIRVRAGLPAGAEFAAKAADNFRYYDETEMLPVKFLDFEFMMPKVSTKRLTDEQMDFVAAALIEARARGSEGENLGVFIRNILNDEGQELHEFAKKAKLDFAHEGLQQGVVKVAQRVQDFYKKAWKFMDAHELSPAFVKAYFPRAHKMSEAAAEKLTPQQAQKFLRQDPWYWGREQTQSYGIMDTKKLLAEGSPEVLGELNTNFKDVVSAQLGVMFRSAYEQDALQAIAGHAARHPGLADELTKIAHDPKFQEANPQLASAILSMSTPVGIPKSSLEKFRKYTHQMVNRHDPKAIRKLTKKLIGSASGKDLSEHNVKALMEMYRDAMRRKEGLLRLPTAAGDMPAIQKSLREMAKQESVLNQALNDKMLGAHITGIRRKALTAAAQKEARPAAFGAYKGVIGKKGVRVESYANKPMKQLATRAEKLVDELGSTSLGVKPVKGMTSAEKSRELSKISWTMRRLDQEITQSSKTIDEFAAARAGTTAEIMPVFRAADTTRQRLNKKLADVDKQIAITSKQPMTTAGRTVRAFRLLSEWETLADLRGRLPSDAFFEGGKKVQRAQELANEVAATKKYIERAGAEEHMAAISARFFGKQPMSSFSPEQVKKIRGYMQKTAHDPVATKQLFQATEFNMAKANIPEKFKIKHPITGKAVPFNQLSIPKPMAMELERTFNPQELGSIAKVMQGLLRPFKKYVTSTTIFGLPRPAFFLRNLVDLGFRGTLLAGFRFWSGAVENFTDGVGILAGRQGDVVIDGFKIPYKDIRAKMVAGDIMRKGFEKIDIGKDWKPVEKILKTLTDGTYRSYRDTKNRVYNIIGKYVDPQVWGEGMEGLAVTNGIISRLRAGIPLDQAISDTRQYLFSFNSLTDWEKRYMRSWVPFYNFSRQAVPFVGKLVGKRPAWLTAFPKVSDLGELTAEEEAVIPQWLTNYPHVKVGRTDKGFSLLSMRNVFTIDIFPDLMPKMSWEGFRQFASQLNPIVLAPLEMMIGNDLYLKRPTKGRKKLWRGMESEFMKGSPIGDWLETREITIKGKEYVAVDATKHHMLTRMWFSRIFREIDTAASIIEGKIPQKEMLGLLTGFKLMDIDLDRQRRILEADSEKAARQYKAALRKGDDAEANDILEEYRLK